MKEEKKVEEVKAPVSDTVVKEDLERRSKMFQVDLEISLKKYQVGIQPLIAPQGPIIQIVDLKNVKK